MSHQKWLEFAEIYALEALDGTELLEFEAHLAEGCELCQSQILQSGGILENLAASYAWVEPPAALKSKIMENLSVQPGSVERPKPAINWAFLGIGVWAFASVIVILSWNLSRTRKEMHELGILMASPDAKVMEMKGLDPNPKAVGRVIQRPDGSQCFFTAMGLASIPQGKVYELWAIQGAEPVPMGTFKVDDHGCAILNLSSFQGMNQFEKFAVTLEPSGGVPKPTGPMHLAVNL